MSHTPPVDAPAAIAARARPRPRVTFRSQQPLGRAVLLAVIGCLGCGGGSSRPAGGGGAGGAAGAGGAGLLPGGGAGGGNACAAVLPADPPSVAATLGLVEAELVAAGRQDASFAFVFGDATPEVLAAADALQAHAVAAAATDRMIPLPATPPVESPDPGTCGVTVTSSALSTSVGQAWESATFLAVGNLLLAIDGTQGDVDYPPLDSTTTVGNITTIMHQTTHVSLSLTQSHAVAAVSLGKSIMALGPGGAALGSTNETATATVGVDFCPNAAGVSPGMITFTGDGTASSGGGAYSYHVQATAAYDILVNDQADTAGVDLSTSMQYTVTGPTPIDVAATLTGSYSDASRPAATLKANGQYQHADGPPADIAIMDRVIGMVPLLAAQAAEPAAKKQWRGGKCVQVVATPESEMVDRNASIDVSATARHKFEMTDLAVPVVATLAGVKSLDPAGKPVASPATFHYVAGSKPKEQGTVTLKSTSKRGIGMTAATYTVRCDGQATCADGKPVDPDTCMCPCQIDPTYVNTSTDCVWMGTVDVSAHESGQGDTPVGGVTDHETWSLSYDAPLSVVGNMGLFANLAGTGSGTWSDVVSIMGPTCTTRSTTADAGTMGLTALLSFETMGGGMVQFHGTLGALAVLTGTSNVEGIGDSLACTTDFIGTQPHQFQLFQVFDALGPASGSTFAGTAVDAVNGPMMPDGTNAKLQISWNLRLVRKPAAP